MKCTYKSDRHQLGQFLTPEKIADLLSSLLPSGGLSLLEIGAGKGALIDSVLATHPELCITAVEYDKQFIEALISGQKITTLIPKSATCIKTLKSLQKIAPFDYVIGNPPFTMASTNINIAAIGKEFGLKISNSKSRLDLLFLACSLSMLSQNGAGAFILPISLFSDAVFSDFRKYLSGRFSEIKVIELPADTFGGAEVSTALCSFSGSTSKKKSILISKATIDGAMESFKSISAKEAIFRMDHSFYAERENLLSLVGKTPITLNDIGAKIVRGSATASKFKELNMQFLHTADLPTSGVGEIQLLKSNSIGQFKTVNVGDIVIPRVGTRCLDRQGLITKGVAPFTDSIFRIQVPSSHRDNVLKSLSGPIGSTWRKLFAHGSCAKHITVTDLLKMPIG